MRSPSSDAVERCRDALSYLRELEQSSLDADMYYGDINELRHLLLKPHFKVSAVGVFASGGLILKCVSLDLPARFRHRHRIPLLVAASADPRTSKICSDRVYQNSNSCQ